jgi:uncharacterized protein (DUF433 family)
MAASLRPSLDRHIEITPGVVGGKPHISGRRITVQNIAIWHERTGKSVDEIAAEYDLSFADIHAALAYYFDHRTEIDEAMKRAEVFVEEQRRATPSKLSRKLQDQALHGRTD